MGLSDNSLRYKAIPYRANWYDSQLGVGNVLIPASTVTGDLNVIATAVGTGGQVRFLRPYKGDIISAKLTMQGTTPYSTGGHSLRFWKGNFAANGISLGTAPSADEKAASWKLISGFDAPLDYGVQDNVFIDGLNILPLIPKRGDADFNEDGFVIGLDLALKDFLSEWVLYDFKIDCNVRMATP